METKQNKRIPHRWEKGNCFTKAEKESPGFNTCPYYRFIHICVITVSTKIIFFVLTWLHWWRPRIWGCRVLMLILMWIARSFYSWNDLLWLTPYWFSATCRSRQILRDLCKIIQADVLLFEQHWGLQLHGVGGGTFQGTYTGRSIDTNGFTKGASLTSALTYLLFFFP